MPKSFGLAPLNKCVNHALLSKANLKDVGFYFLVYFLV